jgi:hypothetical protein
MTVTASLISETGTEDETGITYTHVWQIKTTAGERVPAILAAGVLPKMYATYAGSVLRARPVVPTGKQADGYYESTLVYQPRTGSSAESSEDKPWKQPAVLDWGTLTIEKPFDLAYDTGDAQGDPSLPVVNATRDPYDPPALTLENDMIINIEKNYRVFDVNWKSLYQDTINSEAMTIAGIAVGAGQGLLLDVHPRLYYTGDGDAYYAVGFEIHASVTGHSQFILEQGFYKYAGGVNTTKKAIMLSDIDSEVTVDTDADKQVTEPQLLKANGDLLGPTADAITTEYQEKFQRSWTPLNLPVRQDGKR